MNVLSIWEFHRDHDLMIERQRAVVAKAEIATLRRDLDRLAAERRGLIVSGVSPMASAVGVEEPARGLSLRDVWKD